MNNMFYILKDKVVTPTEDVHEWAEFFENEKNTRVNYTQITDDIYVSTIFVGLDMGFIETIPSIFETMAFDKRVPLYEERYPTWSDAEKGHDIIVKKLKKKYKKEIAHGNV